MFSTFVWWFQAINMLLLTAFIVGRLPSFMGFNDHNVWACRGVVDCVKNRLTSFAEPSICHDFSLKVVTQERFVVKPYS